MTGGVKLEVCFEEDAEFCKRFMTASHSERVVMLAHVFAKQADGSWLDLYLGRPSVKIYERTNDHESPAVGGLSSENAGKDRDILLNL